MAEDDGVPGIFSKDSGEASPHHAADINTQQQGDRKIRIEHEGQRQYDDDARADRHAGDHADDEANEGTDTRRH